MKWESGLPPLAIIWRPQMPLWPPASAQTYAHPSWSLCKTGDATTEACFCVVWKAPWEALCYINSPPSRFINKPILKRNSENGKRQLHGGLFKHGWTTWPWQQKGAGSAPRVHFKDNSAMQRWKWSALRKNYSPHPTLWTLINPDV